MSKAKIRFSGCLQEEEVHVDVENAIVELKGKSYGLGQLSLTSPVSGTIYGTLLNYKGALKVIENEVNEAPYNQPPKEPILYIKPVNTINGYNMPIPLPSDVAELEVGATLGVVIGRTATRVSEEHALDYVAGYTVVNDVTVPHSSVYRPAISQKARDGFCPVGPWVIERDAIENPDALELSVYINGELKQKNTTANLIRPVKKLITDVTEFMTLTAGDTLLVGVPEGAPLVKSGDHVCIEIEGVGTLENRVVHEHEIMAGGVKW
ncbi:fumarylacetoacetate hydrolase family protein [Neobacillus sp. WH10]|uniref:fumarylacetoacetate hydrolase family protein n=1 Tax=Neobacillus sp. WH10 TaxID=3047873 RepID=UPI0024C1C817|nr:fumarylacetoacetate hydrolase family protein [Neobacillus sp. WH10]WHY79405.1 fumarylacetoacetate hydrolase family protein [Neobacillus sp. WH10]